MSILKKAVLQGISYSDQLSLEIIEIITEKSSSSPSEKIEEIKEVLAEARQLAHSVCVNCKYFTRNVNNYPCNNCIGIAKDATKNYFRKG